MIKPYIYLTIFFVFLLGLSCSTRKLSKSYNELKINHLYSQSIEDAAKPQPWEIKSDLVKISGKNPNLIWKEIDGEFYILVSTWKIDTFFLINNSPDRKINTSKFLSWVTTAPELQNLCQNRSFGRKEGLDLRLKQLLGLPPNIEKNYFIEFWVTPKDLFRPCLDQGVYDVNCNLSFPENGSLQYKKWINDLRIESYYNAEWDKNYPWTQLGYTYDWNSKNKNNFGASEFVIDKNKDIFINKIYTTEDYCNFKKPKHYK